MTHRREDGWVDAQHDKDAGLMMLADSKSFKKCSSAMNNDGRDVKSASVNDI